MRTRLGILPGRRLVAYTDHPTDRMAFAVRLLDEEGASWGPPVRWDRLELANALLRVPGVGDDALLTAAEAACLTCGDQTAGARWCSSNCFAAFAMGEDDQRQAAP